MSGPVSSRPGGVEVSVQVQPGARRTECAGLHGARIKIRVAAPPVDGRANVALLEFMSSQLGVQKRDVRIVAGARSRAKRIVVHGVSVEAVRAALGVS